MNTDSYVFFEEKIFEILIPGYNFLFKAASKKGHWDEIRSTSLAIISIQCVNISNEKWLNCLREWLFCQQIKSDECSGSWGEEIWDTAMCLYALKELGVSSKNPLYLNGLNWVGSLFSVNERGNWHDEPWETSWALIAILKAGLVPSSVIVSDSIAWLASLQDKSGKIIAPHYTAYFIIISLLSLKIDLPSDTRCQINLTKKRCQDYLIEELAQSSEKTLWTGEAWANGQVLWALCLAEAFPVENSQLVKKTIDWFENEQSSKGNWSDIEDSASALIGLVSLVKLVASAKLPSNNQNRLFDAEVSIINRLKKSVIIPKLTIQKPLVEREIETGYVIINLKENLLRFFFGVITFIFVGFIGWFVNLVTFLGWLFQ